MPKSVNQIKINYYLKFEFLKMMTSNDFQYILTFGLEGLDHLNHLNYSVQPHWICKQSYC